MTVTLALDTSMIPDTGAGWGMVGAWLGALLLVVFLLWIFIQCNHAVND